MNETYSTALANEAVVSPAALGRTHSACNWLAAGNEIFPALIGAIDAARISVCFEIYIFQQCPLGYQFLNAFIRARKRGVRVRVLIDAIGSLRLPRAFWDPLRSAGGEVRVFNPLAWRKFSIRNHRKLLVCDEQVAFIGGFNVAPEYEGDGVNTGWCDIGLKIKGPLAYRLARSFEEMFARADLRHQWFSRPDPATARSAVTLPQEQLLLSGPGRGRNPFRRALHEDLARAREVRMIVAYFLPAWRLRRDLLRVAKRGGRVQLILAGKTDVPLSLLAGQSSYRRLLDGRLEIYEYQPQILHAKMIIVDNVVYVGSSNLDARSLHINYELMTRLESAEVVEAANRLFQDHLEHCRPLTLEKWLESHTAWRRLKQRWAYFLLNRLDARLANRQWRMLPKPG